MHESDVTWFESETEKSNDFFDMGAAILFSFTHAYSLVPASGFNANGEFPELTFDLLLSGDAISDSNTLRFISVFGSKVSMGYKVLGLIVPGGY